MRAAFWFVVGIAAWAVMAASAYAQTVELSPPGRPNVGPTLTCVEPTVDAGGVPLGTVRDGKDNSLRACSARVGVVTRWFEATSPRGGGSHDLRALLPDYMRAYPVDVECRCHAAPPLWDGAPWRGRATVVLVAQ